MILQLGQMRQIVIPGVIQVMITKETMKTAADLPAYTRFFILGAEGIIELQDSVTYLFQGNTYIDLLMEE